MLSESLESRQLLAGPELAGIQPSEGALLDPDVPLTVAPRELVFQFDDNADINPATLGAITITRAGEDGVFESATVTSDLGSNGAVLLQFRAAQSGSIGNGIQINVTSSNRGGSSFPVILVVDDVINIDLNSNPALTTSVGTLISGINNNLAASALIDVFQVSGSSLSPIGALAAPSVNLTLEGANAAEAVTDFGTNGDALVRFVSQVSGQAGLATTIDIQRVNFGGPANPVVVVIGQNIQIQLNSTPGFGSTVGQLLDAVSANPLAASVISASLQQGDLNTNIGNLSVPLQPLQLTGVTDVVVEPGFIGLGDSPRQVVFRFAEEIPDDLFQIDILGSGPAALQNVDGEAFQNGTDFSQVFSVNLGPQVLAVVPEPTRRTSTGSLVPEIGVIEVHFNDDDLNVASAQNPNFYQLVFTRDTVNNLDDVAVTPQSVSYNSVTNIATLDFGAPLAFQPDPDQPGQFLTGAARLRVGTSEGVSAAPTTIEVQINNVDVEAGSSFDTAFNLDSAFNFDISATQTTSARLSGEIFNTTPFELQLPGPDSSGVREIRPDDPSRLDRPVPLDLVQNGADAFDGISVIQYNFAPTFAVDNPLTPEVEDNLSFNIISEQQKDRVREAFQLFSEFLGVNFVEVEGAFTSENFFSIAVGDLVGGDPLAVSGDGGLAVVTGDQNGDGIDDLGVLDFQDFDESDDDLFGGEFFRGALFVIGQLLGFGFADDLPQPVSQSTDFIFDPGTDNEPAFPAIADIVNGQFLFRPDSTDIDLYRFSVPASGALSIETFAERLAQPSLLDTNLRLFQLGPAGAYIEIAQNDDFFSNDSVIELDVTAGEFVVAVSSRGNDSFDPTIEDSGFGGLTEGEYELSLTFTPDAVNGIVDNTGVPLDGDGDGTPGGVFDFFFEPANLGQTLFVDIVSPVPRDQQDGALSNPFDRISDAVAAAQPGDTIRVVGNGGLDGRIETVEDNFSYQIGFDSNGQPLRDGATLDVPQGVNLVIESGAILRLSQARIGVGSVTPFVDNSDASLQILGTPSFVLPNGQPARDASGAIIPGSVIITSINDNSAGAGNTNTPFSVPSAGDFGGIDFQGALDAADELRRNREDEGVFLNHIQLADIRFGGGSVSIGGTQVVVSPIEIDTTRPTIINSTISQSADAAIAATPVTFTETRFTTPQFQGDTPFTPDVRRVGPEVSGNTVVDNTINGLFVRVSTRTTGELESITTNARFDDTDIAHVLTETLVIEGTPGGPLLQSTAPSSLLVQLTANNTGSVPEGTFVYRLTNVDAFGNDSPPSQATGPVTLTTPGGVLLEQLPPVDASTGFVARRLFRATVDPITGQPGPFELVAQLNASSTSFTDTAAAGTVELIETDAVLLSRLDGSLVIDPGTILAIDGARIEARFGADLIAEGTAAEPIVFTSIEDQRFGAGGTFDTNGRGEAGALAPGDFSGIFVGEGASASIDHAVIAGAGGTSLVEGGFAAFNAIEVQQGNLRLTNTRFEQNADGRIDPEDVVVDRSGRGNNAAGTVFVRASQPIIANNVFLDGAGAPLTFDINSFSNFEVTDKGRSTGPIDRVEAIGNAGPLLEGNVLDNNDVNGVQVRGGELTTAGIFDDVDIVHVVNDSIEIPNRFVFGGLRLQSDSRGSLVVAFEGPEAGIVVGGNLLTATEQFRDIPDRVGGSLQILGAPDFPVILTSTADDTAGAGFTLDGSPQLDTNNDSLVISNLDGDGELPPLFPTGPEVNNGTLIDNDVDPSVPGFFSFQPGPGGANSTAFTTTQGLSQVFPNQSSLFDYGFFVDVGSDGGAIALEATTITQQPTLTGDDLVVSAGSFQGENGLIEWEISQFFIDGRPDLISEITLLSDQPLGNLRFINYYDPVIGSDAGDNFFVEGTPGTNDFRLTILDAPEEIGFRQFATFEPGEGLVNATYEGFIADLFPQLITAPAFNLPFTVDGTIDGDIPQQDLPQFPLPNFGPGIITSALGFQIDPTATSALLTTNLEVIAEPFNELSSGVVPQLGDFNGIVVREGADDRNVAAFVESEPGRSGFVDLNSIPSQAQFLGELAPSVSEGDENQRLGFIVDGTISQRNDIDVFSFVAESNTEVFFDIDNTSHSLDTVVELIDVNGNVIASSNDSILAEDSILLAQEGRPAIFSSPLISSDAAQPLTVINSSIPIQEITISENVLQATAGAIDLSIEGSAEQVSIPVATFVSAPAASIENALESVFGEQLGNVNAVLARRLEGEDFVIQLQFDEASFVGVDVPTIAISTAGVVAPVNNGVPLVVTSSVEERFLASQLQDEFSVNQRDAGFRIVLPGESGTLNLFHVRVRSSNTQDPFDFTTLNDPSLVQGGLTQGAYELQIRLTEQDERAGTQIRLADVRFATNGLQIIGQPFTSPLFGEDQEIVGDDADPSTAGPNDTIAGAQPLGLFGAGIDAGLPALGPLQTSQAALSFGGSLSSLTDVDFFEFSINFDNLTRDEFALQFATIIDVDFASGFARPDTALFVFNAAGELILIGGDSNVQDDLPGFDGATAESLLSGGSSGNEDPFIGVAELPEGTYFLAVANQQQVPDVLDQFFNPDSANPFLRVEPIDSVTRLVEERFDGVPSDAIFPVLFDEESIVDFTLDDLTIFVNTTFGLQAVNAFTGESLGTIGTFGSPIEEVAFAANGELLGFGETVGPQSADSLGFFQIDTADASLSAPLSLGAGVSTFDFVVVEGMDGAPDTFVPFVANVGLDVNAVAISSLAGAEVGFFVADRAPISFAGTLAGVDFDDQLLFRFDPETGLVDGPAVGLGTAEALLGAAVSPLPVGQITGSIVPNDGPDAPSMVLGLTSPIEIGSDGLAAASLVDGDQFVLANGITGDTVTFEFDAGITIEVGAAGAIVDGQTFDIGGGQLFEFNTGTELTFTSVAADLIGTTVELVVTGSPNLVFEFVGSNSPVPGNIGVDVLDFFGQPLSEAELADNLAAEITLAALAPVSATANGDAVVFDGIEGADILLGGPGLALAADDSINTAGAQAINIFSSDVSDVVLAQQLADAFLIQGIPAIAAGPIVTLPGSTSVVFDDPANPPGTFSRFTISGDNGVATGSVAVPFFPDESAGDIAQRIASIVNSNSGLTALGDINAIPAGRSIEFTNANILTVTSANDGLLRGGLVLGGNITGIAVVDSANALFAVTENGALFEIPTGVAQANGFLAPVGQPVTTATDLAGVSFTALSSGPVSFNNGELSDLLFGITTNGEIYAFNTLGELQPVFAGGRSIIETGITNPSGFDFSTLGFNLFQFDDQRGDDPGRGVTELFNGTRDAVEGGTGLTFSFDSVTQNGLFINGEEPINDNPRIDGQAVESTFNFPGGAQGAVQSNQFSLEGFSSADEPVLFFNYFLDTDGVDSLIDDQDSLRIFITTADGVQHLVASNNTARGPFPSDDEFDDPAFLDDDIDVDVQQLFDNTGTFRQARVPLGPFAGQSDLSIRIEFSTAGALTTGSASVATTSGARLSDGETFTVSGETFAIDLTPAVNAPSGSQIAAVFADPNGRVAVTIDGQAYVFNDGTRVVGPNEISVSLAGIIALRGSLAAATSVDIAQVLADALRETLPPGTLVDGLVLADDQDVDPSAIGGRNDDITSAFVLPFVGGDVTFVATGQIGNNTTGVPVAGSLEGLTLATVVPSNVDDVDLVRVQLDAGAEVSVDVASTSAGFAFNPLVRFFDQSGLPVASSSVDGSEVFTAPSTGAFFVAISSASNAFFDPRFDAGPSPITVAPGESPIGTYEATIAISSSSIEERVVNGGNVVEVGGVTTIVSEPAGLFTASGIDNLVGLPVAVSRFDSADEVALALQDALAERFAGGTLTAFPTDDNIVRLPSFAVTDPGPFVEQSQAFANQFGSSIANGSDDNTGEGVILDDFIIGFVERGEVVSDSNPVTGTFITDTRTEFPLPADPVSGLDTGTFQVEIRGGSEFVNSLTSSPFRTFDTNDRLGVSQTLEALPAVALVDGQTFSIFDGRSTLTFEFDLIESETGVTPGNVPLPFTLLATDPITGATRPQTATEIASTIVDAINQSDVQSLVDFSALLNSGIDGDGTSAIVDLFGEVVIDNSQGALAAVSGTDLRGDANADRGAQGIILVENSRFLFNENFGIVIDNGFTATVNGVETQSVVNFPRNLVELNTESLRPGVVVQSNVLAFNGTGGLQINGIGTGVNETGSEPVSADRIVNNTIVGGIISGPLGAPSATVQGIFFDQGAISFADEVSDFTVGVGTVAPGNQNAALATGAPDTTGVVSLGAGGSITLQFTDNLLTGSDDSSPDLIVFETGEIEAVRVEVSSDGVFFQEVGVAVGLANQIDIDAAGFTSQDRLAFVRLTDLFQGSGADEPGADIDAVGALSTVPAEIFEPGGVGIDLVGNVAPILANNVIANTTVGIASGPTTTEPLLGGNAFFLNVDNVSDGGTLGEFPILVADTEVIFADAPGLNFAPAAGASIIDASIDSIEDRPGITTVRDAIGLPPSPILAPLLDVSGQLRVDDPDVETPSGLGEGIFGDVGAADRGDLVGPRVTLVTPQAPSLGPGSDTGSFTSGEAPAFFEIQLVDGLAPADVVPGTGINDSTITAESILFFQDNVPLVEGVDYLFGYNPTTNIIRLTAVAGVFEPDSTFVIQILDQDDSVVQAVAGSANTDGAVLNVTDLAAQTTSFEKETGITLSINPGFAASGNVDEVVFDVFDGTTTTSFELDDDGIFNVLNTPIVVPDDADDGLIAQLLADAVNASGLNLTATSADLNVQFLGESPLAAVTASQFFPVAGSIGTSIGFGLQVPSETGLLSDAIEDGQAFVISRSGVLDVTFEFDEDGQLENEDAVAIPLSVFSTLDSLTQSIVAAIGGSGLGLLPQNLGFGLIGLGNDPTITFTPLDSGLVQLGFAGSEPTVPIEVTIDQTAAEVAQAIADAIDSQQLAGLSTSVVNDQVFLNGALGVSGFGAVDIPTISDQVGNLLQSNQPSGDTILTIFTGSGFDFGDAPFDASLAQNGPQRAVDPTFSLGVSVTPDGDAQQIDADDDDGVVFIDGFQVGFASNLTISVNNDDNRPFLVDVQFDFDGDGIFDPDETIFLGSPGTVTPSGLPRIPFSPSSNPADEVEFVATINVDVPADSGTGQRFARFVLSDIPRPTDFGAASTGEIEDFSFVVDANPFQNGADVNNSGEVTPLDALLVVNALVVNGFIDLSSTANVSELPPFPDVNGDGFVTPLDALDVINTLVDSNPDAAGGAEGESIAAANSIGFIPVASGVLASGATVVGQSLLDSSASTRDEDPAPVVAPVTTPSSTSTSVFDSAAAVQIDSIVDLLAEDTAEAERDSEEDQETTVLDQIFASL